MHTSSLIIFIITLRDTIINFVLIRSTIPPPEHMARSSPLAIFPHFVVRFLFFSSPGGSSFLPAFKAASGRFFWCPRVSRVVAFSGTLISRAYCFIKRLIAFFGLSILYFSVIYQQSVISFLFRSRSMLLFQDYFSLHFESYNMKSLRMMVFVVSH